MRQHRSAVQRFSAERYRFGTVCLVERKCEKYNGEYNRENRKREQSINSAAVAGHFKRVALAEEIVKTSRAHGLAQKRDGTVVAEEEEEEQYGKYRKENTGKVEQITVKFCDSALCGIRRASGYLRACNRRCLCRRNFLPNGVLCGRLRGISG